MNIKTEQEEQKYALFLDASGTLLGSSSFNALGVQLLPDTSHILNAVKQRKINNHNLKTGVITSWGNRINPMLKALKIDTFFDVVVSADSIMKTKPNPEVFLYACNKVGVLPQYAIHVGDSLYDDALGAQSAGLNGIWVRRGHVSFAEADQLKHPVFENLNDVLEYISQKIIL
ncbi:HAD family hydrolase [Spirobacillus cienkowskii]|jgi:putative hydrolase of the HAD superfamily|uniref:HAD family hydrolase n=1 Tax=Spirobacillus cienkowskii TaxID=495820 RepID=A0A369KYH9_9BACT|nr:MAG: HAD family hydrolase [Spirobacillus cienkowskii]